MHPYTGDYTEQRKNEKNNLDGLSMLLFMPHLSSENLKPSREYVDV